MSSSSLLNSTRMTQPASQGSEFSYKSTSTAPRAVLGDDGLVISTGQITLYQHDDSSMLSCFSCLTVDDSGKLTNRVPKTIPYRDILSAQYTDDDEEEDVFADERSRTVQVVFSRVVKDHCVPTSIILNVSGEHYTSSEDMDIVEEIYKNAYPPGVKPHRRVLVLVNPHGGRGKGLKLFLKRANPILEAAKCTVEVMKTEYYRHATDIVKMLDLGKYDVIACASGDGIPYEVLNGLYKREDRAYALNKIAVTQLPCGSGNAMSNSCHGTNSASHAALALVKAPMVNMDLMAVTQGDETTVSFLSQTVGLIAEADVGTEHLRFLGSLRFDIGVIKGMLARSRFPCDVAIKYCAKSKNAVRNHYEENSAKVAERADMEITEENLQVKYDAHGPVPDDWEKLPDEITKNISVFYTGKMPMISHGVNFFPASLPNDGCMDLVMMDARTPLTRQAPIMLLLDSGKHVQAPEVKHSKILAYRLTPKPGVQALLSIDGERYPFKEFQVEMLPMAAKVLMREGKYVETNF